MESKFVLITLYILVGLYVLIRIFSKRNPQEKEYEATYNKILTSKEHRVKGQYDDRD